MKSKNIITDFDKSLASVMKHQRDKKTNDSGTQTKTEIKTIDLTAKEWFDRTAGNSYFSARMVLNYGMPDELTIYLPFQYGYGEHYKTEAMNELLRRKLIPENEGYSKILWRYCSDNKIVFRYDKHERCLKRDVVAFGQE